MRHKTIDPQPRLPRRRPDPARLAELIRELKDPRIGMVTINAVEVTPDYAHAKVFFSCWSATRTNARQALNEAAGFLRNGLFKRLQIHTVPTLHFQFDRTTERAAELNALIAQANAIARQGRLSDATRHAHGCSGAPCTACCCSTSRWACRATTRCRRPSGCSAPRRPATPARSIRWRPACCRCASARRPSSAQVSLDADKRYRATLRLGVTTTTGDAEGEVVERRGRSPSTARAIDAALRALRRRDRRRCRRCTRRSSTTASALYEYARAGVEVERAPRARDDPSHRRRRAGRRRRWTIDVRCSKGTYIRTLAEDIGEALGCGAHLAALRRTGSGALRRRRRASRSMRWRR